MFEISRLSGKGGHAHVQVVPVPTQLSSQVEEAFKSDGEQLVILFEENADERSTSGEVSVSSILPNAREAKDGQSR